MKKRKKKKGDRQRIPSLFLISVPNINNFTLISSITFYLSMHTCNIRWLLSEIKTLAEESCSSLPSFVLGSCYCFQSKFESYFTCHAQGLQRNERRYSRLVTFRNQWLRRTQEISSSMSLEIECYVFFNALLRRLTDSHDNQVQRVIPANA